MKMNLQSQWFMTETDKLMEGGRQRQGGNGRKSREKQKETNEEIISYEIMYCGGTNTVECVACVSVLESECS